MKDIAMHIMDICRNSVRANATEITVLLGIDTARNEIVLKIKDNGSGIDEKILSTVADAFTTTHTTRKIGLGLPLLKQNAELTGGTFEILSKKHEGTMVTAVFNSANIDCPPFGDIAGAISLLCCSEEQINWNFKYQLNQTCYEFSTLEVKEVLDGVSLSNPQIIKMLQEMIKENMKEIEQN